MEDNYDEDIYYDPTVPMIVGIITVVGAMLYLLLEAFA